MRMQNLSNLDYIFCRKANQDNKKLINQSTFKKIDHEFLQNHTTQDRTEICLDLFKVIGT